MLSFSQPRQRLHPAGHANGSPSQFELTGIPSPSIHRVGKVQLQGMLAPLENSILALLANFYYCIPKERRDEVLKSTLFAFPNPQKETEILFSLPTKEGWAEIRRMLGIKKFNHPGYGIHPLYGKYYVISESLSILANAQLHGLGIMNIQRQHLAAHDSEEVRSLAIPSHGNHLLKAIFRINETTKFQTIEVPFLEKMRSLLEQHPTNTLIITKHSFVAAYIRAEFGILSDSTEYGAHNRSFEENALKMLASGDSKPLSLFLEDHIERFIPKSDCIIFIGNKLHEEYGLAISKSPNHPQIHIIEFES